MTELDVPWWLDANSILMLSVSRNAIERAGIGPISITQPQLEAAERSLLLTIKLGVAERDTPFDPARDPLGDRKIKVSSEEQPTVVVTPAPQTASVEPTNIAASTWKIEN